MKVIFICNTIIGRPGNIGYRISKIFDGELPFKVSVISRSGYSPDLDSKPTILAKIPEFYFRLLNAVRIFLWRGFPHKRVERITFSAFAMLTYLLCEREKEKIKALFITDCYPLVIRYFRSKGVRVVLDFPIAPNLYAQDLNARYGKQIDGNPSEIPHERSSIGHADTIVVPSVFVKEVVELYNPESPVHVIPFGVDLEKFAVRKERREPELQFVFAGASGARKGVVYLLIAWRKFVDAGGGGKLHLCGRVYPETKRIISELKLDESVVTPGFVDVSEYFQHCDVYVFPSLLEGSSKSVYEALACGLPVITTFEAGSVVTDGVEGLLVSKCSADEIFEAMHLFVTGKVNLEEMSSAARVTASSYTWHAYRSKVVGILQKTA